MKKLLVLGVMVFALGACTSVESSENMTKVSRESSSQWWQDAGEIESDYWWVHGTEDEQSE